MRRGWLVNVRRPRSGLGNLWRVVVIRSRRCGWKQRQADEFSYDTLDTASRLGSPVIKSDIAIIHCTEGWVTPLHKALQQETF